MIGRWYFCVRARDGAEDVIRHRAGVFHERVAPGEFGGDITPVSLQHKERMGRGVFLEISEHAGYLRGGHKAVNQAQLEELAGELLCLLVVGGGHVGTNQTTVSSLEAASL